MFSAGILLLAEKAFLRYVAINFHRKALAERIAENQLGLRALDRLSNAQPTAKKSPYAGKKGHRSRGSSADMLGANGEKSNGGMSGASSPTEKKDSQKRAKKQRKNIVATVIVDQLGGALEQVTQDQFGSLASAGKLARKLFSTLSNVHPPRHYLIVEGKDAQRRSRGLSTHSTSHRLLPVLPDNGRRSTYSCS